MKKTLSLFTINLTLFSLALLVSCSKDNSGTDENLISEENKCIFIQHSINKHGELIEGEPFTTQVDFPNYSFDETTRVLSSWFQPFPFEITESLKGIYGNRLTYSGDYGGGEYSYLSDIYNFPYTNDYDFVVTYPSQTDPIAPINITQTDADGTIHGNYKDFSFVLKKGEIWENITSEIETRGTGEYISKVNVTTINKITNYGIIDKSKTSTSPF